MTISCERTGDLYLTQKRTFVISGPRGGTITFNVEGYSQGFGGDVIVKIGLRKEEMYHVIACTRGTIHGVEFWGERDDNPKHQQTPLSFEYPIK